MKKLSFLFFILFFENSWSFTLNNNANLAFTSNKVKVNIAQGFCANIGYSQSELLSITSDAVNEYWNKAVTSKLKLSQGSLITVASTFQTGLICNASTDCVPNPTLSVSNDILISCNTNATNFSSNAVLAVTVPNHTNDTTIFGSLIILNDTATNNQIATKSRDELVAIIAHEIGHAIGLGHSDVKNSLMYYSVVPNRRSLGQDDINGITYLYPKEQPISCGSINDISKNNPINSNLGFLFGLIITYLFFKKVRPRDLHSFS